MPVDPRAACAIRYRLIPRGLYKASSFGAPNTMSASAERDFRGAYIAEAYVVFEARKPVFTWASVVDNLSGDSMFVRGIEPVADVQPLP
jgi:hypothetical protein